MKIKDDSIALMKFEEASVAHSNATAEGDYKRANSAYKTMAQVTKFLKEKNKTHLLARFLSHHDIGVRISAAARLLPIMESEALAVLNLATASRDFHSLDAAMILAEWRKGTLNL